MTSVSELLRRKKEIENEIKYNPNPNLQQEIIKINNKNRCSEAISTLKDGVLRFSHLDAIFRLLVIAT
ncbi:hypothetical protein K9L97_04705 [Candidatus Woesearchaeota archaeon]|nr:hypothetical protein [Candidatus Woesearchaeota archaeon]